MIDKLCFEKIYIATGAIDMTKKKSGSPWITEIENQIRLRSI